MFRQQRLLDANGHSVALPGLLPTSALGQQHLSTQLKEFCCYYSTQLSYAEVVDLLSRFTGHRVLCDQSVWKMAQEKAITLSQEVSGALFSSEKSMPLVSEQVDVCSSGPEILVYSDAILVTRQKPKRTHRSSSPEDGSCFASSPTKARSSKETASGRVSCDVMLVEQKTGAFRYLTAGLDECGQELEDLPKQVQAFFRQEYGHPLGQEYGHPLGQEYGHPLGQEYGCSEGMRISHVALPVVTISDGASSIRSQLSQIFGHPVTLILDWFHLCKKVREKLTMIARNKDEKRAHYTPLTYFLWRGRVSEAIEYLETQVVARNAKVRDELIGYLKKHASEIICYETRQALGKAIGSGRVEKAVDQVVGQRQKQKFMSWSNAGTQVQAILKTALLNGQWQPVI